MIVKPIYQSIFIPITHAQELALLYAKSASQDASVAWVSDHSEELAKYVAYSCVVIGGSETSLFLNGAIDECLFRHSLNYTFDDVNQDIVTPETIKALAYLLEKKPSASIELCDDFASHLEDFSPTGNAEFLVSLNSLRT